MGAGPIVQQVGAYLAYGQLGSILGPLCPKSDVLDVLHEKNS